MVSLERTLKSLVSMAGTGFVTYTGYRLAVFSEEFVYVKVLSETLEGLVAFSLGNMTRIKLNSGLGLTSKNPLPLNSAYSVAALNAFAEGPNHSRLISDRESFQNISDNLVEVLSYDGEQWSNGTGLMITSNGYVITAHHVIKNYLESENKNSKKKIMVKTSKGKQYPIDSGQAWYNKDTDIGIIKTAKFDSKPKPSKIKVNLEGKLIKGEEVRVLGFRDGLLFNTIGTISDPNIALGLNGYLVTDLFQTSARGLPGERGGAVVNGQGELIGINVYATSPGCEEVGFIGAAKISNALRYIEQIAATESAKMFKY